MTSNNRPLPSAPLWDWHDQAVCGICAPHFFILRSGDRHFLWRLERRRNVADGLSAAQRERLDRIIKELDGYAQREGIAWP
jgi:hypothetical protein